MDDVSAKDPSVSCCRSLYKNNLGTLPNLLLLSVAVSSEHSGLQLLRPRFSVENSSNEAFGRYQTGLASELRHSDTAKVALPALAIISPTVVF